MTGDVGPIARFVARNRRNRLLRKLASLSRRYLSWHGNLDYDSATNGEHRVLQVIAGFNPKVLFDAGANVGEWSLAAERLCPTAVIRAFEVSPPTFAVLSTNVAGKPRITCYPVGLSDAEGEVKLRHYPQAPALTTSSAYPHPLPFTEITGRVVRGDAEAARLGVEHIDLLKIDVEGMEERVLHGFEGLLGPGRVDVVQFEYGRVNILNGFLLHRAADYFRERGYVIGKIYPGYVDFREPSFDDEDFLGPNYLACRRDRADLIAALRGE